MPYIMWQSWDLNLQPQSLDLQSDVLPNVLQSLIKVINTPTFRGGNCQNCFSLPSENGSSPVGRKFFPFRADPFSEGLWCTGQKQEVINVIFLVKNDGRSI